MLAAAGAMRDLARNGEPGYFDFLKAEAESYRTECSYWLDVFGASGKAV